MKRDTWFLGPSISENNVPVGDPIFGNEIPVSTVAAKMNKGNGTLVVCAHHSYLRKQPPCRLVSSTVAFSSEKCRVKMGGFWYRILNKRACSILIVAAVIVIGKRWRSNVEEKHVYQISPFEISISCSVFFFLVKICLIEEWFGYVAAVHAFSLSVYGWCVLWWSLNELNVSNNGTKTYGVTLKYSILLHHVKRGDTKAGRWGK